jgi:hypothetical protein
VGFFSGTFGAGVNASHCPITRPKRRKLFTLCAIRPKLFVNIMEKVLTNKLGHDIMNETFVERGKKRTIKEYMLG